MKYFSLISFISFCLLFVSCLVNSFGQETTWLCPTGNSSNSAIPANRLISNELSTIEALTGCNNAPSAFDKITLPVVFHIVGSNLNNTISTQYIDEMQIQIALQNLNDRFQAVNSGSLGNPNIEFELAKHTLDGNTTNGIVRNIAGNNDFILPYEAGNNRSIGPYLEWDYLLKLNENSGSISWDPNEYINIWIVDNLIYQVEEAGSIVDKNAGGYAYVPSMNYGVLDQQTINWIQGIVLTNSSFLEESDLTHEMGHFLNLLHPWDNFLCESIGGDCNSSGDFVCDTSPQSELSDASIINCGLTEDNFCYTSNVHNFMDYSQRVCKTQFTHGQVNRMRESLLQSSLRNPLLCSSALDDFFTLLDPINDINISEFLSIDYETNSGAGSVEFYLSTDNGLNFDYLLGTEIINNSGTHNSSFLILDPSYETNTAKIKISQVDPLGFPDYADAQSESFAIYPDYSAPSYDDCSNAKKLTVEGACNFSQTYTTADATNSSGVPNPVCGDYQGDDVWFKFIAPSTGSVVIASQQVANWFDDSEMELYSGSCAGMTSISCKTGGSGNMASGTFTGLVSGNTYYLRFWVAGNESYGQFQLCVYETGSSGPNCFDGIQNQDESSVDCGGICGVCTSCSDGILNQNETGVDCGGVCAVCPSSSCDIPSGLSYASLSANDVTFIWYAPLSGAFYYLVQFREVGGTWMDLSNFNCSSTTGLCTAPLAGLMPNTNYEFRIQSICGGGSASIFAYGPTFTTSSGPACSGLTTFYSNTGSFTDGTNSTSYYSANTNCYWKISPPEAEYIQCTFPRFSTEAYLNDPTGWHGDFVRIYDGCSTSDPLLYTLSGATLSQRSSLGLIEPTTLIVTSSSPCLLVEFQTDGIVEELGWELEYWTPKPDLVVNSFSVPSSAISGNTINVSGAVQNQGLGTSSSNEISYFLSQNSVWDSFDMALGNESLIGALNSSNSTSFSSTLTLPSGLQTGTWYIIAVADFYATEIEEDDSNNFNSQVISINTASAGAPQADFNSILQSVCEGDQISFNNLSSGGATSYSWSFPGGSPPNSTSTNPTITYNTPGIYNVSLTASNSLGSNTLTESNFVSISSTNIAASGDLLWDWAEGFGGASFDSGSAIGTDSNGNVYVAGSIDGSVTIGGATLNPTYLRAGVLVKHNALGVFQWAKQFDFSSTSNNNMVGIDFDSSDNIYICGNFSENAYFNGTNFTSSSSSNDVFLVKYSSGGSQLWAKKVSAGSGNEYITGIDVENSDVFITGYFENSSNFGGSSYTSNSASNDIFIAKYNNAGNHQWSTAFGGSGSDKGLDLEVNSTSLFVTGSFSNTCQFGLYSLVSTGNTDIFLSKLNANNGAVLWATKGGGNENDNGQGLDSDSNGNIYLTGRVKASASFSGTVINSSSTNYTVFTAKYNSSGILQWINNPTFTGSGYGLAIELVVNSNNTVFSFFKSVGPGTIQGQALSSSTWYSRYDEDGGFIEAASLSGLYDSPSVEFGQLFAGNDLNDIVYTGMFNASTTIGSATLSPVGSYDIFISKLELDTSCPSINPTITTSGPTTFCNGSSIELTAPDGYSYSWNNGEISRTIEVNSPGSFKVTVSTCDGCTGISNTITVNTNNPLSFTSSISNAICGANNGYISLFPSGGTPPYSYNWDSYANNQTSGNVTGLGAGTYQFTITDANGCNLEGMETVLEAEDYPIAAFQIIVNELDVSITDLSTDALTGVSYSFGDGGTSSAANPNYNYSLTGNYYVCQTVENNCGSDQFCQFIETYSNCALEVTNTNDAGPGSLREAIICANTRTGSDEITFNLGGAASSYQFISLNTTLPDLIDNGTTINAESEPNFFKGKIVLDGSGAGVNTNGLNILGDNYTIKGIYALGFNNSGIYVEGNNVIIENCVSSNHTNGSGILAENARNLSIKNCFIGTTATGTVANGNANHGIHLKGVIGATITEGNLISANGEDGIKVEELNKNGGTIYSEGIVIQGNIIGLNVNKTTTFPNADDGIHLLSTYNCTIGGDSNLSESNIISGNGVNGIYVSTNSQQVFIYGNAIGLEDIAGINRLGNQNDGIEINNSSFIEIGKDLNGYGNTISANEANGINIKSNSTDLTVFGNSIGYDFQYLNHLGNNLDGIEINNSSLIVVGKNANSSRNYISNNGFNGIDILNSTEIEVNNNIIGVESFGDIDFGNKKDGINISGCSEIKVGTNKGNYSMGNHGQGIDVLSSTDVKLWKNKIGNDGSVIIPNYFNGLRIINASFNIEVGGSGSAQGNVIGGNGILTDGSNFSGVSIGGNSYNITVQNNYIGCDNTGQIALPNEALGVLINDCNDITVGLLGDGNTIKYNLLGGVSIRLNSFSNQVVGNEIAENSREGISINSNSTNNLISQNSIYCNSLKGIELNSSNLNIASPIILDVNGSSISGTAEPNSIIEIFESDTYTFSNSQCSGEN